MTNRGLCWHPSADPIDKGVTDLDAQLIAAVAGNMPESVSVYETGAFPGTITRVLIDNLPAHVWGVTSWEAEPAFAEALGDSVHDALGGLRGFVWWFVEEGSPDSFERAYLTVIDSSPYDLRNREIDLWAETARPDALLVVHDVFDGRWRKTPTLAQLRGVELGGPWGVGIYRKGTT